MATESYSLPNSTMPDLEGFDQSSQVGLVMAVTAVLLASLYFYLLPKPIKGIPYNTSAAASLLGDIPAMEKESNGNAIAWIARQAEKFSSPVCQVFILPFGKPVVYLTDYHEAQDILMRRKEFDRSDYSIDLLGGLALNHHINLKTGPTWKGHRQLLQDLMTPKFLNSVAGRNIYVSASRLVTLWGVKARVAAGRPFQADKDIYYTALDAVLDFTFGSGYADRALPPQIEAVQTKMEASSPANSDAPVHFPEAPIADAILAILQASEAIGDVVNLGFISLAWLWKRLQPKEREFRAIRRRFLKEQAQTSVTKLQQNMNAHNEKWISSASDLMLQREHDFAEKQGRKPLYWSETIHDEMLGFVVAGHDTTSTTLCWGVKFLADGQTSQQLLREALYSAHAAALAGERAPTYEEITSARIPYLDAVVEEILRLAHTLPFLERQCSQDTVILGHPVPKGTTVFMPGHGPSLTKPGFEIDDLKRSESSQNALAEKGKRTWPENGMNDFQPERWLSHSEEKPSFDGTAGPTLAFGLGIRGCFGRKLAYLEMKIVLTLLIWNFDLQPCSPELSNYEDILGLTRQPQKCYVRLQSLVA